MSKWKSAKEVLDVMQAVATIFAFLVGGVWAIWQLQVRRELQPRLDLEQDVAHRTLTPNKTLLIVDVEAKNNSLRQITLQAKKSFATVYQILPLTDKMRELFETERTDYRNPGERSIDWGEPIAFLEEPKTEMIEPGEKAYLHREFTVPASVCTVLIYSYFENEDSEGAYGWQRYTVYDLKPPSDCVEKKPARPKPKVGADLK